MGDESFQAGLARVAAETDPVIKHLLLAALCTRVFAARGIDLIVVGGSAIEFYTDGAYTSGDIDLCIAAAKKRLTVRDRQEAMGILKATGGPRSWQVVGIYVDVLGDFETCSKSKPRRLETELGEIAIAPPEELIVERILVSKYPESYPPARECAGKVIAAALRGELEMDWQEVRRMAKLPEFQNETDVLESINAEAKALGVRSPYDSRK
jgi:hypothetical protein